MRPPSYHGFFGFFTTCLNLDLVFFRAYVVHANPATLKTAKAKVEFANSVVKWMETQVARHKRLRGGVGVVEAIPKRYPTFLNYLPSG
jgi:hypothetical protein